VKDKKPCLHIIAGPNGSGKSTFSKEILFNGVRSFDWDAEFDAL